MTTVYFIIVVFLLCLAMFDLFVGVSNDAVNFLQSAVGARVAKFRTILIVASVGVLLGAVMSTGMMDVARHGIMMPDHYSFHQVMTIFLAVMVTDVIILDMFNTLGMPTSTTVSLVFELLGGTFMLACDTEYMDRLKRVFVNEVRYALRAGDFWFTLEEMERANLSQRTGVTAASVTLP